MSVPVAVGSLIVFVSVCALLLLREVWEIANSVQVVSFDPIPIGENYACPTCKAFWNTRSEEIHFQGCIAPIVRRVPNEAKARSTRLSKK